MPTANEPLDEIDHPVLRKAAEQFSTSDVAHERIRAIDDNVLFKVKARRWRGAVFAGGRAPMARRGRHHKPEGALPDRALRHNEQAWSNIMDTTTAAKLLELE